MSDLELVEVESKKNNDSLSHSHCPVNRQCLSRKRLTLTLIKTIRNKEREKIGIKHKPN